jgi:hypothetical protein
MISFDRTESGVQIHPHVHLTRVFSEISLAFAPQTAGNVQLDISRRTPQ